MNKGHLLRAFLLIALVGAGCSSLPGLRVLTGEDPAGGAQAEQLVASADLVMADKSGSGDPSLMAAADRIEAATGVIDVIEIRRDDTSNAFKVSVIIPRDLIPQDTNTYIQYLQMLQRVVELSWQGTLHESEGSGTLQVTVLTTGNITTLNAGESMVGLVLATTSIDREDALAYLASRPHSLNDFADLILGGTLSFEEPTQLTLYEGQPNHPMFLRDSTAGQ